MGGLGWREEISDGNLGKEYEWEVFKHSWIKEPGRDTRDPIYGRKVYWGRFFIFSNNTTAESAYFDGTSYSSELNYCVMRLKLLEMSHRCKLCIFHVYGNRMIDQGADGLSRETFLRVTRKGEISLSLSH